MPRVALRSQYHVRTFPSTLLMAPTLYDLPLSLYSKVYSFSGTSAKCSLRATSRRFCLASPRPRIIKTVGFGTKNNVLRLCDDVEQFFALGSITTGDYGYAGIIGFVLKGDYTVEELDWDRVCMMSRALGLQVVVVHHFQLRNPSSWDRISRLAGPTCQEIYLESCVRQSSYLTSYP